MMNIDCTNTFMNQFVNRAAEDHPWSLLLTIHRVAPVLQTSPTITNQHFANIQRRIDRVSIAALLSLKFSYHSQYYGKYPYS